ncbi:hypothetical protein SmJEL517_g04044 [Synchytrium microbalum]|uniref:Nuclear pore complex protein n=1 Tax=Synchytrium microbalum TaxID=1806994 RepID=A0A507C0K6_9FUNG|nr:uncharacterized protein SmJEL517_g04044 [Synchytrium microbalum]TPX32898.1 hypothetical protein SmJEL517_g04044 [Synchytrium microbalum]
MSFPSRTPLSERYASTPLQGKGMAGADTSRSSKALAEFDSVFASNSKRMRPMATPYAAASTQKVPLSLRAAKLNQPARPVVSRPHDEINLGDEHDTFAILLESAPANYEELQLVKSFQEFCDARIRALRNVDEVDSARIRAQNEEVHIWELERHTWDLIQRLLDFRLQDVDHDMQENGSIHAYSGDFKLAQRAIELDSQLQEHTLVVKWLEDILPPYLGIDVRPGAWSATGTHVSSRTPSDTIITEMDPDAPNRQKRKLVEEDQTYQDEFNRAVFEYIRRGQYETAYDLCVSCGQPWRTASLLGVSRYRDGVVDDLELETGEGNQNVDLWKAVCYAISCDDSFDKNERATYAVLGGDIHNALPVCETWEDVIWLHYTILVQRGIEDALRRQPQPTDDVDAITLRIPTEVKDAATIFLDLCNGSRPDLREVANEQIRLLQSFFIMNRLDEYLRKLVAIVSDSDIRRSLSMTKHLPNILRIAVHLVLILRNTDRPTDEATSDVLIRKYIQMLIAGGRHKHIALFTSNLPREEQTTLYSHFLADNLESRETRHQYFRQAFQHGLDYHQICRQTVRIILERGILKEAVPTGATSVAISELSVPLSEVDAVMIRALEWVAFEEQQRQDLVTYCNILLRRFLIHGRMNAAKSSMRSVPLHFIPREWIPRTELGGGGRDANKPRTAVESIADEYVKYMNLLDVYALYAEWVMEFNRLPVRAESADVDLANYLRRATTDLETKIEALLDSDWFDEEDMKDKSDDVKTEFRILRDLYIPEVVFILHRILFETRDIQPGNLDKSLRIAETVARRDGPWKEMQRANKLDKFMQMLRNSALQALNGQTATPWSSPQTV